MALPANLLKLVKESKNKHTRAGNSVKLKEGKTTLRLLPNGDEAFWLDIAVHWIKTEKNGKPVAVVGCRDEVYGEPCEICTAIQAAQAAATSDEEVALIKEWRAKKSVLVNALVRSGPDASETPQIVELTPTTWGKLLGTITEYHDSDVDLLDPTSGQDFVIERRGKGLDTDYNVMLAPRSKPVPAEALKQLHDLKVYAEQNYFRGDEKKAITAIAQVSGISVGATAIAGPRRSPMLTAPASSVEDAEIEEVANAIVEAEAEAVEEVAPEVEAVAAEPVETDEERELREFREFKAAQAARAKAAAPAAAPAAPAKSAATAAAKPAAAKPAAAKPAPAAPAAQAGLAEDEINDILAELDNQPAA